MAIDSLCAICDRSEQSKHIITCTNYIRACSLPLEKTVVGATPPKVTSAKDRHPFPPEDGSHGTHVSGGNQGASIQRRSPDKAADTDAKEGTTSDDHPSESCNTCRTDYTKVALWLIQQTDGKDRKIGRS